MSFKIIGEIFRGIICVTLMAVVIFQCVRKIDSKLLLVERGKLVMVKELKDSRENEERVKKIDINHSHFSNKFATKYQLQLGASILISLVIYVTIYCRNGNNRLKNSNQKVVKV